MLASELPSCLLGGGEAGARGGERPSGDISVMAPCPVPLSSATVRERLTAACGGLVPVVMGEGLSPGRMGFPG